MRQKLITKFNNQDQWKLVNKKNFKISLERIIQLLVEVADET